MSVTISACKVEPSHTWLNNKSGQLAELNASNANFGSIMRLLGYDSFECTGDLADYELHEFRDKVVEVLNGLKYMPELDGGTPTEVSNNGRWIDCGVSEGYYINRLTSLLDIVDTAIEQGGLVTWG